MAIKFTSVAYVIPQMTRKKKKKTAQKKLVVLNCNNLILDRSRDHFFKTLSCF